MQNKGGKTPVGIRNVIEAMSDAEMATLLIARPDLVRYRSNYSQLISGMLSPSSIHEAITRINQPSIEVLDALVACGGIGTAERIGTFFNEAPEARVVEELLERLATACIVLRDDAGSWTTDHAAGVMQNLRSYGPPARSILKETTVQYLRAIAENLGVPETKKLRKAELISSILAAITDPRRIATVLAEAPKDALEALATLRKRGTMDATTYWDWNPRRSNDEPRTPQQWLHSRGIAWPINSWSTKTYVLPVEVYVSLAGGTLHDKLHVTAPTIAVHPTPHVYDRAGIRAYEVTRDIAEILDLWHRDPPPSLRSGGFGRRELTRLAKDLGRDIADVIRLVELIHGTGLAAPHNLTVRLTTEGLYWLEESSPAERWAELVLNWLVMERHPSRATITVGNEKPRTLMRQDNSTFAIESRGYVLAQVSLLEADHAASRNDLAELLTWMYPSINNTTMWQSAVDFVLDEANMLGLTVEDAPGPLLQALIDARNDPTDGSLERAAAAVLPKPHDKVLLLPDLTAVASGPLDTFVAAALDRMARTQSRGAGQVWRFDEASVRHALDTGSPAAELLDFLAAHSEKGVPTALEHLVKDVARSWGKARVQAATAVIDVDEVALAEAILADGALADLQLRRVTDTVLSSPLDAQEVLAALRRGGYSPDGIDIDAQAVQEARPAPSAHHLLGPKWLRHQNEFIRAIDRSLGVEGSRPEVTEAVQQLRASAQPGGGPYVTPHDNDTPQGSGLLDPSRVLRAMAKEPGLHELVDILDAIVLGDQSETIETSSEELVDTLDMLPTIADIDAPNEMWAMLDAARILGTSLLVGYEDYTARYTEALIEPRDVSQDSIGFVDYTTGRTITVPFDRFEWAKLPDKTDIDTVEDPKLKKTLARFFKNIDAFTKEWGNG